MSRKATPKGGSEVEGGVLRLLPQIDVLVRREDLGPALDRAGRALGLELLRGFLDRWRARIRAGELSGDGLRRALEELPSTLDRQVDRALAPAILPVVNATGVVVHTNLGRAALCPAAQAAMARVGDRYSNLEYDLQAGRRGSRSAHLSRHLERLFPSCRGLAVNNNAAALLLALNTLARGKEVIVSRGELVEIGGSFRIPEILERSGAVLREVGTTNRTRVKDYRDAIGPETALLLKVHPSNYRIVGFTQEAAVEELAALGQERGLPVIVDQGSGVVVDLSPHGIDEAPVSTVLDQGADLVLFSGDKLLGGPQAGLAVGRREEVEAMASNPMARALRLDKVTTAALDATLAEYVQGTAMESIPVLRMVSASRDEIAGRAERLAAALEGRVAAQVELQDGGSVVGGGAWPLGELPTRLLSIRPDRGGAGDAERALRAAPVPVIARVEGGRLLVDLRTVLADQEDLLRGALLDALAPEQPIKR